MKKLLFLLLLAFPVTKLWSQDRFLYEQKQDENRDFRVPLIGEKAPSFTARSTNGEIKFPGDYGRSWKILLSHPQDFTPVCTTEMLELANLKNEFDRLGVKLVVVSTDALDTHEQWKKSMEGLTYKNRTHISIDFPLVDDEDLSVSKKYGMIHALSNTTKDVRGVFILDPENVIQAEYFYPSSVGRNTDELVRTVTALQRTYADKVLTPANWKEGDDVMVPAIPDATATAEELQSQGLYNLSWFMWYKKGK